jgi:hypothetical protein
MDYRDAINPHGIPDIFFALSTMNLDKEYKQ